MDIGQPEVIIEIPEPMTVPDRVEDIPDARPVSEPAREPARREEVPV